MYIYIYVYTHTFDIGFCIPPDGAYGALELWSKPLATSTAPRSPEVLHHDSIWISTKPELVPPTKSEKWMLS